MAKRRGAGLAIAGVLGGVAAVALTFGIIRHFRGTAAPRPEVTYDASTPAPILAVGLRHSDARALLALSQRVYPKPNTPLAAVSEAEAESLIEVLGGLQNRIPQVQRPCPGGCPGRGLPHPGPVRRQAGAVAMDRGHAAGP